MKETKLPEELEEQAILDALGILDPEDRPAFMVRLQGESDLLRQVVKSYHATTGALTSVVAPVTPPVTLRERLVNQVALEAAREAERFELAADTLALGSVPVTPRDSLRERLLSRIEGESNARFDLRATANIRGETSVPVGEGMADEREKRLLQDDSPAIGYDRAGQPFRTSYGLS
ncbi:MAG: hypothetical protein HC801_03550 [Nitrospira sp.]|nr:hypothetical protein [Nitrospira sp.]